MNELSLAELVGTGLSVLSPLVTIFVLWKVGVIGKKNGNGHGQRIQELEEFKTNTETNHFHDIESLRQSVDKLWESFNDYRIETEGRLSKLEK